MTGAGLAVVNVANGKVTTLAKWPPDSPLLSLAWSPAGGTIVGTSGNGFELERFNSNTGREQQLSGAIPPASGQTTPPTVVAPTPSSTAQPVSSASTTPAAVQASTTTRLVSSATTVTLPTVTVPAPQPVPIASTYYQSVVFSSDGRYLAEETEDRQGACTIETTRVDGTHPVRLISTGLNCTLSAWIRTPKR